MEITFSAKHVYEELRLNTSKEHLLPESEGIVIGP